jgi:hypothetical protein
VSGNLIEQAGIGVDAFDYGRFVAFPTYILQHPREVAPKHLIANQFNDSCKFQLRIDALQGINPTLASTSRSVGRLRLVNFGSRKRSEICVRGFLGGVGLVALRGG